MLQSRLLVGIALILVVFQLSYNEVAAKDFATNTTTKVLTNKVSAATILQASTFYYPQVILQYIVTNTNSSSSERAEVAELFSFFDSGHNTTTVVSRQNINGSANETTIFSPTDLRLSGSTQMFNASLTLNTMNATNTTSVSSTLTVTVLQTQLITAATATIKDTYALCPGVRYLYVDVPNDGNAYNLTLQTDITNITQVFSNIYLRHNATPDLDKNIFDFVQSNTTTLEDENGYSFGSLLYPGKWWIAMECRSDNPSPDNNDHSYNWDITGTLTPTCTLECFKLNHGSCSGEPAFCNCYTWWSGDNCEKLFSGVYVLIVLAVFFTLASIVGIAYGIYNWNRKQKIRRARRMQRDPHNSSQDLLLGENAPLILSDNQRGD